MCVILCSTVCECIWGRTVWRHNDNEKKKKKNKKTDKSINNNSNDNDNDSDTINNTNNTANNTINETNDIHDNSTINDTINTTIHTINDTNTTISNDIVYYVLSSADASEAERHGGLLGRRVYVPALLRAAPIRLQCIEDLHS